MQFNLYGPIKPYTRMTRRGKWTSPAAQAYLESQEALRWQIAELMAVNGWQMIEAGQPLAVDISITVPKRLNTFDLDNAVKAVIDAAQSIVFKNDLWINQIIARRQLGEEYKATLKVEAV